MEQPLLAAQDDEHPVNRCISQPYSAKSSGATHWHESAAEELVRLRNYPTNSIFRPLKRTFLPRLAPFQLLEFFKRAPGPRCTAPYYIRPATFGDVPEIVMMQARSDWDMPVIQISHPQKETYPQDYLKAYQEGNLMWMTARGAITYVAVGRLQSCVDEQQEEEEVVGFIRFSRQGEVTRLMGRQGGWRAWLVDMLMSVYLPVRRLLFPYRSTKKCSEAEKQVAKDCKERYNSLDKHWKREDLKERWFVESLDVKDEWRGRGLGRALMEKAVEMAVEDQQPIGLVATEMGSHLYHKMGFESLESIKTKDDEKNSRFELMIWDPKNKD